MPKGLGITYIVHLYKYFCIVFEWLTDFNGMSHLSKAILYLEVKKLHSYLYFCAVVSYDIFAHGLIEYTWVFNKTIRPMDETLTDTTTTGQSGPGSNSNEKILHIS